MHSLDSKYSDDSLSLSLSSQIVDFINCPKLRIPGTFYPGKYSTLVFIDYSVFL